MKREPRRHLFNEDVEAGDYDGAKWCLDCPLPETHEVHQLPETPPEFKAFEARKLGDRQA